LEVWRVARDIAVDGGNLGTGRSDSGSGKYDGVFAVTDRAINVGQFNRKAMCETVMVRVLGPDLDIQHPNLKTN
jgi:hypothetical protein